MHDQVESSPVLRHKTAICRSEPSLPVKCLVRDSLCSPGQTLLDYGCGQGGDVEYLNGIGIDCKGWDPVFRPDAPRQQADVVNLAFVLNVIESPEERAETLGKAWSHCRRAMVVAARIAVGGRGNSEVEYNDGVLTRLGTFQKYFSQAELRAYLESQLGVEAVPAAPGVFYLFRDEELLARFQAQRYRRRSAAPQRRLSELRYEQFKDILEPLMEEIAARGRPPEPDEYAGAEAIQAAFGSIRRAFALIQKVTGGGEWERIRQRRSEDLLVYMALSNFRRRPRFSALPQDLQRDMKYFFGSYDRGCRQADALLFRAGDPDAIDEACKRSKLGKLLPNAIYVHRSALEQLEPLLRVYEGCAHTFLGEIEGANIVKLHRFSGKVSYLIYPRFDLDPQRLAASTN